MTSVGAELPRQIERVAAKRQRWRWRTEGLRKEGFRAMAASIEQTIAVMTRDLDAASEAIGSGDVLACLRAYEALRGYSDDD